MKQKANTQKAEFHPMRKFFCETWLNIAPFNYRILTMVLKFSLLFMLLIPSLKNRAQAPTKFT